MSLPPLDLRRLQVFSQVYERRSFSRAAEDILLSQPTVSGHIKCLEDELGVRLFDRLGRKIIPTRAADLLHEYAVQVLKLLEEATSSLDALMERFRGELRLGGSTIPGEYLLPTLLGAFREQYPEVRATLIIGDTGGIAERVLEGDLELGVVGAVLAEERLLFEPLLADQVILAAPPGHPLGGQTIAAAQLAKWPLVLREPGSGTRLFVTRALAAAGLELAELQVAAQVGSSLAVRMATRAGVGLGFVSRRAAEEDLAAGRLTEVAFSDLDLRRQFHLVTRRERTHSPAAQAFMELCRRELAA